MDTGDPNFAEAIGSKKAEFQQKIKLLQKKWQETLPYETQELRIIAPLLFHGINLTDQDFALMADNVSYFKQHYHISYRDNYLNALNLACLFGSQQVAEFLIAENNVNILDSKNEFIIISVAASLNIIWAKHLVAEYASNSRELPTYLFSVVSEDMRFALTSNSL